MLQTTTSLCLFTFGATKCRHRVTASNPNSCQHSNNCALLWIGQTKPFAHSVTWPPANTCMSCGTDKLHNQNFTLQVQDVRICLQPSTLECAGNSILRKTGSTHQTTRRAAHSKTLISSALRTTNSYSAVLLNPQIGRTNRHSYEVRPNYE
jgi:hypothetical protein